MGVAKFLPDLQRLLEMDQRLGVSLSPHVCRSDVAEHIRLIMAVTYIAVDGKRLMVKVQRLAIAALVLMHISDVVESDGFVLAPTGLAHLGQGLPEKPEGVPVVTALDVDVSKVVENHRLKPKVLRPPGDLQRLLIHRNRLGGASEVGERVPL